MKKKNVVYGFFGIAIAAILFLFVIGGAADDLIHQREISYEQYVHANKILSEEPELEFVADNIIKDGKITFREYNRLRECQYLNKFTRERRKFNENWNKAKNH